MSICNCFYCKYFTEYTSLEHKISAPFKNLFYRIWFAPVRYILKYNRRDWNTLGRYHIEKDQVVETLRPFYGYKLEIKEVSKIPLAWWKQLRKVD